MNSIFIEIGGICVKISFHEASHPSVEDNKKDIAAKIKKTLRGFIVDPQTKTAFNINFIEQRKELNTLLVKRKRKEFYMRIFEEVKENELNVYYSISFYEFLSVLSYLLSKHLSKNNGFVIHSSAIAKNGVCYLFLGMSGAGKSTAVRLLRNDFKVLADDTGILKREKGKLYFYQTPFIERYPYINKGKGKYLVKKAFILRQDKEFKAEIIKNKNEILNEMILFNDINSKLNLRLKEEKSNVDYVKSLLTFVSRFDEFYYLYFAKNSKKLLKLLSELK